MVRDKHKNHHIKISDLCKSAQDRLAELRYRDIDELFSLHLTSKNRVWGILRQGVLSLLWWDPEHQICPSAKKHT